MSEVRTEPATPRKLRLAREKGEVWRSSLLTGAVSLLAVTATFLWLGATMFHRLRVHLETSLREACSASPAAVGSVIGQGLDVVLACLAPVLLTLFVAVLLVELLQVGPLFTLRPLTPRATAVDPLRGLRRLFDGRGFGDLGFAALQVVVVGAVLVDAGRAALPTLAAMVHATPEIVAPAAGALLSGLLGRGAAALLLLGALDVLRQRARFARDQRMTRREVLRERRDAEGDPATSAERWRIFRELATGRGPRRSGHAGSR